MRHHRSTDPFLPLFPRPPSVLECEGDGDLDVLARALRDAPLEGGARQAAVVVVVRQERGDLAADHLRDQRKREK